MILYRYFFKNLLFPILSISAIFISIIWLTQSVRFVEVVVAHSEIGMFKSMLEFAGLLLPDIFVLVLPFSTFFSILFIYNRFLWDRELTIMRAIGLNNFMLSFPAIGIGICVAGVILALNIFVLPYTNRNLKNLEHSLKESTPISIVKEREFNNFPGLTLYLREKEKNGEIKGIFAYVQPQDKEAYTLMAEKGFIKKEKNGGIYLFLHNGTRQEIDPKTQKARTLYFKQTFVSLKSSKKSEAARSRKTSELSLKELFSPDPEKYTSSDILKMRAEGHSRMLFPFLALAYTLMAVSVILLSPFRRTGFTFRIVWACSGVILLQMLSFSLINLSGKIPHLVSVLYAIIFFIIIIALYFLKRSDKTIGELNLNPLKKA